MASFGVFLIEQAVHGLQYEKGPEKNYEKDTVREI